VEEVHAGEKAAPRLHRRERSVLFVVEGADTPRLGVPSLHRTEKIVLLMVKIVNSQYQNVKHLLEREE